jgi:hypothetical protein
MEATSTSSSHPGSTPLADPVAEARRVVDAATNRSVVARVLGGAAVHLQSPDARPLLPRPVKDIDLATPRGARAPVTDVLSSAGYTPDEMFNALHGASRLLFYDQANDRKLDVFVGSFAMCHQVPVAERLDRDPLTVPLAELVMTKLQIVELTERDQRDVYNLFFHHDVSDGTGAGIEADYIARVLAGDWGFWRTSKATVERCLANVSAYDVPPDAVATITRRLETLWQRVEAEPKSTKWKLRSRVGDRVRWYDEPEEHTTQG